LFHLLVFFALHSDPPSAVSLLQQGLTALQHGQVQEARSELEEASRLDSKNAYVWSSLAEVYRRLNQGELAALAAKNAEASGGDNPVVAHALAKYYSETGQFGRAAQMERRYAESAKADPGALSRAAELSLKAGNSNAALELAQRAQARHPSPMTQDLLAQALAATGHAVEAVSQLRSAWETDKLNPQIAFDWSHNLLQRSEFTEAAEVAQTILRVHPDEAQMMLVLGVARYGQRRFDEAITVFLKVIESDPQIEQPYLFLGRMLDQAGDHLPTITRDYEQWAASDPKNAKAQLLLAKALLTANVKNERAETLLRRAIALDPGDWESHYELGVWLSNGRKYSDAAEELGRAIELAPKQPEPHYHLARVYDRLGQPERAKAERELHQSLTTPRNGMP